MNINKTSFFDGSFLSTWFPKKEEEIIFKPVQERDKYIAILPNEILKHIFLFLPDQARLSVLPKVCYQFNIISKYDPFYANCYHLHHLIPNVRTYMETSRKSKKLEKWLFLHIMKFTENEKLSSFLVLLNPQKTIGYYQSFFKLHSDWDNFDAVLFIESCPDVIASMRTEISDKIDTPGIVKIDPCVPFFRNLDDDTWERIVSEIIAYRQDVQNGIHDLIGFKARFFNCFNEEEREKAKVLFEKDMDVAFQDLISKNKDMTKFNNANITCFAYYSKEKAVEILKQEFNKLCNCPFKNSLFLLHGMHSITPVFKTPQLEAEYRWFAEKITKKV